jgi:molybdopterin-binding protein
MDLHGFASQKSSRALGARNGPRPLTIGANGMDSLAGQAYLCRMTLSARNRLEGKVVEIQFGGVMAHVVVSVGKNLIESVITKRSADEMKLKVGDAVSAVIKATEVMLEKA